MSEVSGAGSVSSDELGFLADFIFVEEEKHPTPRPVHSETTVYDSEYDDGSCSTSDEPNVPPKKPKQRRESLSSTERLQIKRERNRIGAKNTRVKKKQYLENLQSAISRLTDENDSLNAQILCLNKALNQSSSTLFNSITTALGASSSSSSCKSSSDNTSLFSTLPTISGGGRMTSRKRALVLTSSTLPDNPVVFTSKGFQDLSGYGLLEILGKNPRIMQGTGSDPQLVDMLGHNVKFGLPVTTRLLNFKRGNVPFFNHVSIAPLKDSKGRLVNFVGIMKEVSTTVVTFEEDLLWI